MLTYCRCSHGLRIGSYGIAPHLRRCSPAHQHGPVGRGAGRAAQEGTQRPKRERRARTRQPGAFQPRWRQPRSRARHSRQVCFGRTHTASMPMAQPMGTYSAPTAAYRGFYGTSSYVGTYAFRRPMHRPLHRYRLTGTIGYHRYLQPMAPPRIRQIADRPALLALACKLASS
jgi:hypothetical protein